MKKTLCILLCLFLLFSFASCGNNTSPQTTKTAPQTEPETIDISYSLPPLNLETVIQKATLLVKASYQYGGTTFTSIQGCDVGIFFDRYSVTEVLYGEYTDEIIAIEYMPYTYIEINTNSHFRAPDTSRKIDKTEGTEYLLLLQFYNGKWCYSDFRFVIPAEDPSSTLVDRLHRPCTLLPIADNEHTVPLTDIDTQEKFVQYALTIIDTAE